MGNPLHQFLIVKLFHFEIAGLDISFTNSSLFMVLGTVLLILFQYFATREKSVVPGRLQGALEVSYDFIASSLKENAGREGLVYFPFIFSLFMFVLFGNMLGMFPYAFTHTSHIIVTFALAMMVFVFVTILGLVKLRWRFFRLFFPEGTPLFIAPILVPIEIIAYFVRPISLSVRLFANMLAGHVILKLLGGFTVAMGVFGILPLALNVLMTGFEFFVAAIQAYIFTVLSCLYIHDALHSH
jgi:F-type H+-transporting ATPase subunit a